MRTFAVCLFAAIIYLGGISACVYLVMHDHPWFAIFVLCASSSVKISAGKEAKCGE